jgi:F-type H+-transporting ATPase subunit delta
MGAVYAEALAEAAETKGALAAVGEEVAAFAQVWRDVRDVRAFFLSGAIRREAKTAAIDRVCRGRTSDLFADFLHVLLRRNRLWLLPHAADAFAGLLDRKTGRVPVHLATAAPVAPPDLEAWTNRLAVAIGGVPVLTHQVKPHLIGGAVLRVGDVVADGSVRRRLAELTARIRRAPLPASAVSGSPTVS